MTHSAPRRRPPPGQPPHPGTILRDRVLPALGLSVSQAARDLNITRQTLHRLLAGTAGLTPSMALRLGRLCGTDPAAWLDLQRAVDLWQARRDLAGEIERIPIHGLAIPLDRTDQEPPHAG